jgi:hypothetical protein
MALTWASVRKPELVYLRRFDVRGTPAREDVHLLAARYELTEVLVGGDMFGDGYFLEYFVAEQAPRALVDTSSAAENQRHLLGER